jgi:hypothetical protein
VKTFLADEWDKTPALKRRGGVTILSLDLEAAKGLTMIRPMQRRRTRNSIGVGPNKSSWRRARGSRRKATSPAGRKSSACLMGWRPGRAPSLAEGAIRLEITVNTLKSHLYRARTRHARIIRELMAQTVSTPDEIELELRHLLTSLGG